MKRLRTVEEAADKAFRILDRLNPQSLSAFWSRISQLVDPRHRETRPTPRTRGWERQDRLARQLNAIYSTTMGKMETFGFKELAETANGFAKTANAIHRPGCRYPEGAPEQILHEILVGEHLQNQTTAFQSIASAAKRVLPQFDARHLSNLAYAYAIANVAPTLEDGTALFDHIAKKSLSLLSQCNARDISNLVWSFEKVGAYQPKLFGKVADHVLRLDGLDSFNSQDLSNILLAFAKSGESNPRLFKKIADHVTALDNLRGFKPRALVNIVWACAEAGETHPKLLETIANHFIALDSWRFKPNDLANTVRVYAKAGEMPPKLFQTIADHIVALDSYSLHQIKPPALAHTVWAYSKAAESHPRLFKTIGDHIVELEDLHAFEVQDFAQILEAYGSVNIVHPQLFEKIPAFIDKHIDYAKLDKESLQSLLWAFEAAEKAQKSSNKN